MGAVKRPRLEAVREGRFDGEFNCGKPDLSAVKWLNAQIGPDREVSMDLSFLGWIELSFSRSLQWVGLHPAGSSAFMQSPPSYARAAEI